MTLRMCLLMISLALLWGCDGPEHIFEQASLNRGDEPSFIIDAKQRVITNIDIVNKSVAGQVLPKRIVCAEPSPDVASAFSEALQASISKGDGEDETGAKFSRSTAESVAALGERLATVQLLRDMAYRNCEAYANGSINATSYTISNSRLHKTIVTLLASEMMAGAFGRTLPTAAADADTETDEDSSNTGTTAGSVATLATPGKIEDRGTHDISRLDSIHERFIEDDSFVTLVDACVAHLNTIPILADQDNGVTQDNIHKAQENLSKEPFSKLCILVILPKAVQMAHEARISDRQARYLQKIVKMCGSAEKAESPACKSPEKMLPPVSQASSVAPLKSLEEMKKLFPEFWEPAVTLTVDADTGTDGDQDKVAEGGGTKTVRVTATLDGRSTFTVAFTVKVEVGAGADGATEDDYDMVPDQEIKIEAGMSSGSVEFKLTPNSDSMPEGDETITIDGTVAGLTVMDAEITIEDDDVEPTDGGESEREQQR